MDTRDEETGLLLGSPTRHHGKAKIRDDMLDDDTVRIGNGSASGEGGMEVFPRVTLSWENLRYSIPVERPPVHRRIARFFSSVSSSPPSPPVSIRGDGADDEDELLLVGKRTVGDASEKEILRGVDGIVHPGELCAIMGASGNRIFPSS